MSFRFLRSLIPISLAIILVMAYPAYAWASPEQVKAMIASGVLAFVNILIGMISIEFSMEKSMQVFMNSVFGGMVFRMFMVLGVILVLIKFYDFDKLSLVLSLMGYYVIFVAYEISYVVKELNRRNAEARRKSNNPVYKAIKK